MQATFTPSRTGFEATPAASQRMSAMRDPPKNAPTTTPASAAARRSREPGLLRSRGEERRPEGSPGRDGKSFSGPLSGTKGIEKGEAGGA